MDAGEINLILERVSDEKKVARRVSRISSLFVGRPYVVGPLEGGENSAEVFNASLDGFDCVTFIETVLALARASTPDEFAAALREIRYANGEIDWRSRNHYMVDWARNNEERGFVRDLTRGDSAVEKTRTLNMVKGLPENEVTFRCFPKRTLPRVRPLVETGDLMLFASTRKTLDVFHAGILIKSGEVVRLRHAARSAGKVVEQPLTEFLDAHRMSGFILLRPL